MGFFVDRFLPCFFFTKLASHAIFCGFSIKLTNFVEKCRKIMEKMTKTCMRCKVVCMTCKFDFFDRLNESCYTSIEGSSMMRYSYDISTKDKEISYANLVDKYLLDLGFGINKNGTKYLRDLILTAYFNQSYSLDINLTIVTFFEINNIREITKNDFIKCIFYTINNINAQKSKENFNRLFKIQYDIYYFTPKNLTILFMNLLSKTSF